MNFGYRSGSTVRRDSSVLGLGDLVDVGGVCGCRHVDIDDSLTPVFKENEYPVIRW